MGTTQIEFVEIIGVIKERFPGILDWAVEHIQRLRETVEREALIAELSAKLEDAETGKKP